MPHLRDTDSGKEGSQIIFGALRKVLLLLTEKPSWTQQASGPLIKKVKTGRRKRSFAFQKLLPVSTPSLSLTLCSRGHAVSFHLPPPFLLASLYPKQRYKTQPEKVNSDILVIPKVTASLLKISTWHQRIRVSLQVC
jgi:hypothetical protein